MAASSIETPSIRGLELQGKFIGSASGVGLGHLGIVRVDHHRLRRPREQFIGMRHQVLIEGVLAGDQRRQRFLSSPSRPTGLLAESCQRAREGHDDGGVETADVDAEFEGVGGDHPCQFATEDLCSTCRRWAGVYPAR